MIIEEGPKSLFGTFAIKEGALSNLSATAAFQGAMLLSP